MRKGFSLVELILVIGLVSILAAAGAAMGGATLSRGNVRAASERLVTALLTARSYAMSGREDANWGVYITPGQITSYKGSSYATRDSTWDESYSISSTVNLVSEEVNFTKITGEADAPMSVTIGGSGGVSRTVTVSALGLVEEQ